MNKEQPLNYCEHFQNFKPIKKITIDRNPFCKLCMSTNSSLWICLHKDCGVVVCGKSNYVHLLSHLQQSKKKKSYHSIFINAHTSEIRCQDCKIQILDFDQLSKDQKQKTQPDANNPLKFRFAVLPYLQNLGQSKITGQLQYPEGHRKINRGLVGIFANRQNYSLIPAIQFIAHCEFFKDVILTMRLKQQNPSKIQTFLKGFKNILQKIDEASLRVIRIDEFMQLMIERQPNLTGYKRKDPFQHVLELLNVLHEYLNFYKVANLEKNLGKDEWDMFYKFKQIETHCPIYDSLASTLTLKYKCQSCGNEDQLNHQINYIKLEFPKKRRKPKVVEKQLSEKGYESLKKRGKSLMSLFLPEEELPITIPELLIEFFRQPFQKEKFCSKCRNQQKPMKPGKVEFKKIADILILQINRMPRNSDEVIDTQVVLNYDNMNLGPFIAENKQKNNQFSDGFKGNDESQFDNDYEFVSAVGIDKGVFPIVCKSIYNNRFHIIKNETVEMLSKKFKLNPYIVCLKRVNSSKVSQFYQEIIKQNLVIAQNAKNKQQLQFNIIPLPDFYHIQLRYGIALPSYQPLVCKHHKIKPYVERKCEEEVFITQQMYHHLVSTFKGTKFTNQVCKDCEVQVELINKRKTKEKQLVKDYDSFKTNANVMVQIEWLKKWFIYLYSPETPSYFHKGNPLPPPIDNTILLQNNKCRSNLVKNKDFKVVNIFVYKLLKQLYSGGPEIRYKWNSSRVGAIDENKFRQIRMKAAELKSIFSMVETPSPKKSLISQKKNNLMEIVTESDQQDELQLSEGTKQASQVSNFQ